MTPARWSRLRSLFHEAMERDPSTRRILLDELLASDPELHAQLSALLRAHEDGGSFLEPAADRAVPPAAEEQLVGGLVAERYRILRPLGRGGSSIVFLAEDERIGRRRVVLKVLDRQTADAAWFQKRFRREIEILGRIDHPGIVAAHDCGELPGGRPFLVMDFVDGITLRERLHSPIAAAEIAEIVRQLGPPLAEAHRLRIFHRDLKPENIMLQKGAAPGVWSVKLIDFGIARIDQPGGSATTGLFVAGTAQYMAPEQFQGNASAATDIYALAAICCEMLTGRTPFVEGGAGRVDALPGTVRPMIRKALSFDPRRRPQDAGEFARAVAAGLIAPPARRRRAVITAAALLAAAAGVLLLHPALVFRIQHPVRLTRPIRLTAPDELALDPAVSADGQWIAYASDREGSGQTNIWLREVATGQTRRLTDDRQGADEPSFSPDDATLAYHSHDGAIYTIPLRGGPPVKLVEPGRRPRYSPDGGTIAYSVGDPEAGTALAYVISAGGEGAVEMNEHCGAGGEPVWSPAGRYLLIWCKTSAGSAQVGDFWPLPVGAEAAAPAGAAAILEAQGLRPPLSSQTFFTPEAWFDDRLIFAARRGKQSGLWSIHLSESTGKAEGPAQFLQTPGAAGAYSASASLAAPAGRLLVFSTLIPNIDLWKLPLGAHGSALPAGPQRLTSDPAVDRHPSLAADGRSLAFVSDRSGLPSVWKKDLVVGTETQLTHGVEVKLAPRISPDGSRILFTTEHNHARTVWLVRTAPGSQPLRLCTKCGFPRAWWPDQLHLLLDPLYDNDRNFGETIYSARPPISYRAISGGGEVLLPTGGAYWVEPKVSADGAWIVTGAYVTGQPPTERIFVVPVSHDQAGTPQFAPRENWIEISDRSAMNEFPAWGVDGSIVYFLSNCDGHTCIWARRLDPATRRPIGASFALYHSHGARLSLDNLGPSAGIDPTAGPGELVFAQGQRTGSIWMTHLQP